MVNPFKSTLDPYGDAFVTKLNAAGSALVYSTYLGGAAGNNFGYGIGVDGTGAAWVSGYTTANNFPTQSPTQAAAGGGGDALPFQLAANGQSLAFSTYIGGSNQDYAYGLGVNVGGTACVAGFTASGNFPKVNAEQATLAGGDDAFVTCSAPPPSSSHRPRRPPRRRGPSASARRAVPAVRTVGR